MSNEMLPRTLLRQVTSQRMRAYAQANGWRRVAGVNGGIALFDHPGASWDQLLVPMDETYDDYDRSVLEVIRTLSGFESRAPWEVLNDLLMFDSDVLRFRVGSAAARRGTLPLSEGIRLLEGARRSLLAAASSVIDPVSHHPRMTRAEALQFVNACQMGQTERGSFTATVSCPLHAVEEDPRSLGDVEPFARSATSFLMRSLHRVVVAIEADEVSAVFRQDDSAPTLSANFCDALLKMQPPEESSTLTVSATWASTLPPRPETPTRVRVKHEYFSIVEEISRRLRPVKAPAASLFVGYVETLNGQPGDDGRMQGETTLSTIHEEEMIKARADLGPDDYQKAVDAHRTAAPVRFKGILHRGHRVHRVAEIHDFSILQR
jgi:hypothetical protein